MSATTFREKRQTTVPLEVAEAAGLRPGDQMDWRFESGEIRVRKLIPKRIPAMSREECLKAIDASPLRFKVSWDELKEETR